VIAHVAARVGGAMIFGLLLPLDATLTLPPIAGIVPTISVAVDSNVLICDWIREEIGLGRSSVRVIGSGFKRAIASMEKDKTTSALGEYGSSIAFFAVLICAALAFLWISHATELRQLAVGIMLSSLTLAIALALFEACWHLVAHAAEQFGPEDGG
jgi:hypothetical protein